MTACTDDLPLFPVKAKRKQEKGRVVSFKIHSLGDYRKGVSEGSQIIAEHVKAYEEENNETITLKSNLSKAIENLSKEVSNPIYVLRGWDGYSAEPLNKKSAVFAKELINILIDQYEILEPEFIVEPDGDVAFLWSTNKGELTISISSDGLCSFSALMDDKSEYFGSFILRQPLSKVFLEALSEIF